MPNIISIIRSRIIPIFIILIVCSGVVKSQTIKLGQNFQGGKVIHLDASKKHGLIAHFNEDKTAEERHEWAKKLASEARFGGFQDWRLPTKEEMRILYSRKELLDEYVNHPTLGRSLKFGMRGYWWTSELDEKGWPIHANFKAGKFDSAPDTYGVHFIFVRSF
jgi:hypothetical protein